MYAIIYNIGHTNIPLAYNTIIPILIEDELSGRIDNINQIH